MHFEVRSQEASSVLPSYSAFDLARTKKDDKNQKRWWPEDPRPATSRVSPRTKMSHEFKTSNEQSKSKISNDQSKFKKDASKEGNRGSMSSKWCC